jgi:hypothetical protein
MNQIYLYNYTFDTIEEMTLEKFRRLFNQDYIDMEDNSIFYNKQEALQRQKVNREVIKKINEKKTSL